MIQPVGHQNAENVDGIGFACSSVMVRRVLISMLALIILGCGGVVDVHPNSEDTSTGGAGGTSTAEETGGIVSHTGGAAQVSTPLCDGSDDIRLEINVAGGFVDASYAFTNPYGHLFLYINGKCEYYVSEAWYEGIFHGTLTQAQGSELESAVGWGFLASWSQGPKDQGCPDSAPLTIRSTAGSTDCNCGCDADAAPEKMAVFDAIYETVADLRKQAMLLDGPVKLLLLDVDQTSNPTPWPLAWDPGEQSYSRDKLTYQDYAQAGYLIDDVDDTRALRAERDAHSDSTEQLFFATEDDRYFQAYIIDILPDETIAKIGDFLAQ